jgi:D-glycero-alpha-D-manno-heptose 1-phosphate guanylyltransferase
LSLGYKHEVITEWLKSEKRTFKIDFIIETEPLGTGGGIQLGLKKANDENVVVLNGDTMFRVTLKEMMERHILQKASATLALKEMQQFERYGVVNMDTSNHIVSFEEKKYRDTGNINGGIYVIRKQHVFSKQLPEKFSFERDYFEAFVDEGHFYGFLSDAYFIDIGIPEDYERSQSDFKLLFK